MGDDEGAGGGHVVRRPAPDRAGTTPKTRRERIGEAAGRLVGAVFSRKTAEEKEAAKRAKAIKRAKGGPLTLLIPIEEANKTYGMRRFLERVDRTIDAMGSGELARRIGGIYNIYRTEKPTAEMKATLQECMEKLYARLLEKVRRTNITVHTIPGGKDYLEAVTHLSIIAGKSARAGGQIGSSTELYFRGLKQMTEDELLFFVHMVGRPDREGMDGMHAMQAIEGWQGTQATPITFEEKAAYYADVSSRKLRVDNTDSLEALYRGATDAINNVLTFHSSLPQAFGVRLLAELSSGRHEEVRSAITAVLGDDKLTARLAEDLADGNKRNAENAKKMLVQMKEYYGGETREPTFFGFMQRKIEETSSKITALTGITPTKETLGEVEGLRKTLGELTWCNTYSTGTARNFINTIDNMPRDISRALDNLNVNSVQYVMTFETYTSIAKLAAAEQVLRQAASTGEARVVGRRIGEMLKPNWEFVWKKFEGIVKPLTPAGEIKALYGREIQPGAKRIYAKRLGAKVGAYAALATAAYIAYYYLAAKPREEREKQELIDLIKKLTPEGNKKFEGILAALTTTPAGKELINFLHQYRNLQGIFLHFLDVANQLSLPAREEVLAEHFTSLWGYEIQKGKEKDFILLLREMQREWDKARTLVEAKPAGKMTEFEKAADAVKERQEKTGKEYPARRQELISLYGRLFVEHAEKAIKASAAVRSGDTDYDYKDLLKNKLITYLWRFDQEWNSVDRGAHILVPERKEELLKLGYIRKVGTLGMLLTLSFAKELGLTERNKQYLVQNPALFQMMLIGLGEGVLAPSAVEYYINHTSTNRDAGKQAAAYMKERLKNGPDEIAKHMGVSRALQELLPANDRTNYSYYFYLLPVAVDSIVRYAELWGMDNPRRYIGAKMASKSLHELATAYNDVKGAAKRLNDFKIAGMHAYVDVIDLALRVAHGTKTMEQAIHRGEIGSSIYAQVGIKDRKDVCFLTARNPDTGEALKDESEKKRRQFINTWVVANQYRIFDGAAIMRYIHDNYAIIGQAPADRVYRTLKAWEGSAFKKYMVGEKEKVGPRQVGMPKKAFIPLAPLEVVQSKPATRLPETTPSRVTGERMAIEPAKLGSMRYRTVLENGVKRRIAKMMNADTAKKLPVFEMKEEQLELLKAKYAKNLISIVQSYVQWKGIIDRKTKAKQTVDVKIEAAFRAAKEELARHRVVLSEDATVLEMTQLVLKDLSGLATPRVARERKK